MSMIDPSMIPIIFGKPLYIWGGVIAIVLLLVVFTIGYLLNAGKISIDLKWHKYLAYLAVFFALAHAIVAILIYF